MRMTPKFSAVITKRVDCERCGVRYLYELERAVTGHSYALELTTAGLVVLLVPVMLLLPGAGWTVYLIPVLAIAVIVLYRMRGVAAGREAAGGPLPVALENSAQNDAGMAVGAKLRRELEAAVEPVACPKCGWYQREMVAEARGRVYPWFDRVAFAVVLAIQAVVVGVVKNRHLTETGDMLKLWAMCTAIGLACAGAAFVLRWVLTRSYDPNVGYPNPRPPYPGAPEAILEADYLAKIGRETARITAATAHAPPTVRGGGSTIITIRQIKLLPPGRG